MKAQVNNRCRRLERPCRTVVGGVGARPDTTQIKGNYTHDELPSELGYRLTVPISMANDYNGYIASYREYQSGDHYRKALTAWGPHSSDYLVEARGDGRPSERRARAAHGAPGRPRSPPTSR